MSEPSYQPETLAIHAGTVRSQFGEHSEALFLTSSFVFENAAQAAARFIGEQPGNIYARFTNPTVTMFEERLAAMEGAEQCIATASGMSAILACVMGLLKAGLCAGHHYWHATQCGLCKLYPGKIQLYHWIYRLDDRVYPAYYCVTVHAVLDNGKTVIPQ